MDTQKLSTSGLPRTHVNTGIATYISISPNREMGTGELLETPGLAILVFAAEIYRGDL